MADSNGGIDFVNIFPMIRKAHNLKGLSFPRGVYPAKSPTEGSGESIEGLWSCESGKLGRLWSQQPII